MADNVVANAGTGGSTFGTDEVAGVHYPRSKAVWGPDGTVNDVDVAAGKALPIQLRNSSGTEIGTDGAAIRVDTTGATTQPVSDAGGSLTVDDGSGSITVDAPVGTPVFVRLSDGAAAISTLPVSAAALPLPSGAATAANQATANAALGTLAGAVAGTEVQVDVLSMPTVTVNAHAVTNAGTFVVQENGAALTALQLIDDTVFAEDAAASAGDKGIQILAVRRDANTTLVGADNDYAPLQVNADGSLKVAITAGAGSGGTSATDDAAFSVASGSGTPIMGLADETSPDSVDEGDVGVVRMTLARALHVNLRDASGNELSSGAQYAEDAAHTTGDLGTMMLTVRKDTAAATAGTDGDYQPPTTDASGRMHVNVGALPAGTVAGSSSLPAGTNNIGDVDILSIAAGDNNIGNVDIVTMPNVTLAAGTNTNEVVGDAAHDAAVAGNPVRTGGRARTSDYTSVANDDTADFITDVKGKQIVLPYAIPENFVSGAITSAMTGTTSTSLLSAPASGLRNYITTIIVSNAHATVGTDVAIQDGNGGTTIMTIPAAAVYGGAVISLPVPLRQPTTATAIYCANVTTGASTKVSAVGYTAP